MICRREVWTWSVLVLCAAVFGCTSLPDTSRTAVVQDVKIEEKLSSDTLSVRPGDEVRWVNHRKLPVRVEVPSVTTDDLSCQRGFTNWMGSYRDVAILKPNETAALCFKKPVVINYIVRAETSLGGGMQVLPGKVSVEGNTTGR
jgi:plastocyanin